MSEEQWLAMERVAVAEAQAAGHIAPLPLDELMLSAQALMHGLAHLITEGKLGDVDDAKATELAIAVSRAIGIGFVPRGEAVRDPRGDIEVKPVEKKPLSSWRKR